MVKRTKKANQFLLSQATYILLAILVVPLSATAQVELKDAFVPFFGFPGEIEGRDLFRHIITDPDYPDAVCNDGSPAVMYVRAGNPKSWHANDWVILTEAGGNCLGTTNDNLYRNCQDRWSGNGTAVFFTAWKMSTDPDGDGQIDVTSAIEGEGLFQQGVPGALPPSVFADWNQVLLNYCSSDGWRGNSDLLTLSHSQGGPDYYIRFRGHTIMEAAINKLRAGGVQPDQYDSKADAHFTMPSLQDAKRVVLAGTSAGASGVTQNADWLASQLGRPIHVIVGANFQPRTDYLDPNNDISNNFKDLTNFAFPLIKAFTDTSCVADLQGTGLEWKCGQNSELLINHLDDDNSIFVRQDLSDGKVNGPYLDNGVTLEEFIDAVLLSFQDLVDGKKQNSYWAPRCSRHEAITSDEYFFNNFLASLNGSSENVGKSRSYNDAVSAWLLGQKVRDSELHDTDPRFPLTTMPCP